MDNEDRGRAMDRGQLAHHCLCRKQSGEPSAKGGESKAKATCNHRKQKQKGQGKQDRAAEASKEPAGSTKRDRAQAASDLWAASNSVPTEECRTGKVGLGHSKCQMQRQGSLAEGPWEMKLMVTEDELHNTCNPSKHKAKEGDPEFRGSLGYR